MKFTQIDETTKIAKIDKQSFLENSEKVMTICLKILASYEKSMTRREYEKAKNNLYSVCSNLFLDGDATFFILTRDKKPVSFCIYSKHQQKTNTSVLEMIYTKADQAKQGFATTCLQESFKLLGASGEKNILFTVNTTNENNSKLFNRVIKSGFIDAVVDIEETKSKYAFDLTTIEKTKDEEATL